MKNKTKKLFAGIGLAVIGMSALAGCAMSDEQERALNTVTANTEKLVNLIDDYLTAQNKQMTKQDAYEMLVVSSNMYKFGYIDQVSISGTHTEYLGYFEKKKSMDECVVSYKHIDGVKYYQQHMTPHNYILEPGQMEQTVTESIYCLADFNNDYYYVWDHEDNEEELSYNDKMIYEMTFSGMSLQEGVLHFEVDSFDANDIYDIIENEDGSFLFKIFSSSENFIYEYSIIVKDGLFQKFVRKVANCDFDAKDLSWEEDYTFDYSSNISFDEIEEKHNQLLTQQQ